ncbi:hypothetical protein [Streptomyces sp. A1-5]|uniref:hypothetical protein n=1 Tax=Streptomyces sp. A1-5 TaxID=2738410 RepID=UPI001F1A7118|nr:hypothetical protein [Streptomyces sp. A1-5]UJB43053.1 hypothetical protein HRD51_21470 [Streptomyces sp. A1-5]
MADRATDAEVGAVANLVSRYAKDEDDCLELLDTLGLLRSALEGRGLIGCESSAEEARGNWLGEYDIEEFKGA